MTQQDKHLEKVLDKLKTDHGWDYYNSLTEVGRKLVKDTLLANEEVKQIPQMPKDRIEQIPPLNLTAFGIIALISVLIISMFFYCKK